MKRVYWLLLMLTGLANCRTREIPDTGTGEAALLGVSLAGFPAQNVQIDQSRRQIILTIPDSLRGSVYRTTSFQTAPGSTVWAIPTGGFTVDLTRNDAPPLYVLSDPNKVAIYTFVVKPAGPLRVRFLDNQPYATTARPLALLVDNLIDGQGLGQVILTRRGTTERDTVAIENPWPGDVPAAVRATRPQLVLTRVPQHIRPGDYTVDVVKSSGRRATADQLLTFRRGTPSQLEPGRVAVRGERLTLTGENLFPGDAPEWQLTTATGTQVRLKPATVTPYGWAISVDLPADLPAGYYASQIWVDGQPVGQKSRLAVVTQADQPAILTIADNLKPLAASPLVLRLGQYYQAWIMPQLSDIGAGTVQVRLSIQLSSLADDATSEFVFSTRPYNGDYPPALVVPTTLKPGLYRLRVVATYADGRRLLSEPLEQPVQLMP